MKASILLLASTLATALLSIAAAQAQDNTASAAEAKYTKDIEARTAAILALVESKNSGQSNRIHDAIMDQYRALRSWHDTNDATLKQLGKTANGKDKEEAAKAQEQIASIKASLKTLHDQFIAKLSADLPPADVEQVKDKMTYNKVKVTYDAYCAMVPTLTDEQKTKILDWLKEAREEAMDAGSSDEKSNIFNKYKGRINNYLSKQGIDMGKASKEYIQKMKAEKESGSATPAK
jgi:hypothetical protein